MLNLVAPVQTQIQTKQPAANTQDYSRPDESEAKQFNNILEREVAEKESAQLSEKSNNISKEKRPETSEPTNKTADTDDTTETIDTTNTTNTNSQKTTNSAIDTPTNTGGNSESSIKQSITEQLVLINADSAAGALNQTTQNPSAKINQHAAIEQIAFSEYNPATGIIAPPLQIATAPLAQSQLNGNANKSGFAQTPGSVTSMLSSLSASQQSVTQNAMESNDLWQQLQTANSADNGKTLSISAVANKELLARTTGDSSMFPQIDTDAAIQQPGLSSVAQTFSHSATQAIAPHHLNIDTQIGQPKWNGEFAQKIVWLTNQQHQVAELRLNPAHLGPVEIMLSLTSENGTQASAQFVSPHLAVREAIESALPRLREMMAENGIQLGDVMVGAESFQRQEQREQPSHYLAENTHAFDTHENPETHLVQHIDSNRHSGIVNTFA